MYSPRARGGFTLLEIVIVLLVLAVATAAAVPAFRSLRDDDRSDIDIATLRVQMLFRLARDSAVRGGTLVTVLVDSASSRVWLDARESHGAFEWAGSTENARTYGMSRSGHSIATLMDRDAERREREGESLELPGSVRMEIGAARARFTFSPGGATFGDSLVLRAGTTTRVITLNRWTGDVIVQ
jgi:prepilin-type N-terminal cleavage/methylation domain-containing protein